MWIKYTLTFIKFLIGIHIFILERKQEDEKEPKYNVNAFKETVEVAYDIKDKVLDKLKNKIIYKNIWKNRFAYILPVERCI